MEGYISFQEGLMRPEWLIDKNNSLEQLNEGVYMDDGDAVGTVGGQHASMAAHPLCKQMKYLPREQKLPP